MNFKAMIISAAMAIGLGTMAPAASCTVGSCTLIQGGDGDTLSDGAIINIAGIENGVGGTFEFTGNFLNDTIGNAAAVATVLQFNPSSQGNILNLVFDIVSPAGVSPQSFQITDALGFPVGGGVDVSFLIDLLAAPNAVIGYMLSGTAITGDGGSLPGVNMTLTPAVPLPAGILLMGTALAGFGVARRRKKS